MNIKKIIISLAIVFVISFNSSAQESKDGFYVTYNDYLKGNVKTEGEIFMIGKNLLAPHKVYFQEDEKKDLVIKNSNYWGCIFDGESYRFYNGKAYRIILWGKIVFYSIGHADIRKDENGIITEVYLSGQVGDITLFFHKGDDDVPKKMWQNKVSKLLSDDPEVLQAFNKGKGAFVSDIYLNIAKSVQLYNSRNK